jgi:amino acid transporter
LSLGLLPIGVIWQDSTSVLAKMAEVSTHGQRWLSIWVSIDAIVVLSGGVLTSYVGVTGLARNMSSDRCLPQFLLRKNSVRGTNHWIIIGFFLLTFSLMFITGGKVQTLGT